MMENTPEPRLDPPEPFCIIADCQHEVYDGESLFEWETYDQKTGKRRTIHICPDCFEENFNKAFPTNAEKAELLGMEYREIKNPNNQKGEI